MLSRFLKIILIALIIAFMAWLKYTTDSVTILVGNYSVETSLFNIISLFIIIAIPLWIIVSFIKAITNVFIQKAYISSVIYLIKSFNTKEERDVLLDLLLHNTKAKDLRRIKDLRDLINNKKYDKALYLAEKTKLHPDLQHIVKRYACLAYEGKGDLNNFISTAKKSIDNKKYNFWFFQELANYYLKNDNPDDIKYLKSILNKVNFSVNKEEQKIYTSVINYKYAQFMLNENKIDEAKTAAKFIINTYPDFIPMYYLLGELSKKDALINMDKYLIQVWIASPNFLSIQLWLKYISEKGLKKTLEEAVSR